MPRYVLKDVHVTGFDTHGTGSSDEFDFGMQPTDSQASDPLPVEDFKFGFEKVEFSQNDDALALAVPQEQQEAKYTGFQTIEIKRPPEPPKDHTNGDTAEAEDFDFSGLESQQTADEDHGGWIPILTTSKGSTQNEPSDATRLDTGEAPMTVDEAPIADDFVL